MALIYDVTFDSQTRALSLLDKAGNVISSCEVPSKGLVDNPNKPLMLRAIEDNSSVTLINRGTLSNTYQTSTDGTNWTDYTLGTKIFLNKEEVVYFRCSSHPTTQSQGTYVRFEMTGKIEAWHNAYSMISSDFSSAEGSVGDHGMRGLFGGCASLTKAPLLVNALSPNCYYAMFSGCDSLTSAPQLPATTLAEHCYRDMFNGCTGLTSAPQLPSTTLAEHCYRDMFNGCTGLTSAPQLPVTTLADYCYYSMFYGCTSLTSAPQLPATTLANSCYFHMFNGCTSLTSAPQLPSTTLAEHCYRDMFYGCTSLTSAPQLPATTLANSCYSYMFGGCTSLTSAPQLPATTLTASCYASMFIGCSKLKEVRISATKTATGALKNWLANVSATGDFYCDPNATIFPTDSASGIPSGWTRIPKPAPTVDDPSKPLMLRAIADNSSVTLQKNGKLSNTYQTSTDGTNWTDYAFGNEFILNNEDVLYFRCSNHPTTQTESDYVCFKMTGEIEAWHNAYSMISSDFSSAEGSVGDYGMNGLFENCASLTKAPLLVNALSPYCYSYMFNGCTSLTSAPQLPATTLNAHCYHSMFEGCTSLTSAPQLPVTTLADSCYHSMFKGCTSLTSAPQLPATTLADSCYSAMFRGCTSLTSAPQLPATTLANSCYAFMFYGCTSLTSAPQLPVTTLADSCYDFMFKGCTSLTSAPQLPATTLKTYCYRYMFNGCSKLKEVRIAATKTATDALFHWLDGVSATGDFYCDPNATIFPTGVSGIPEGWTRHALADYPVTP